MAKISRRPSTADISWFIDQYKIDRLDLDPPYQRRSVWTPKDRRYFIDTIFRGFPCPPIYIHKTIDDGGNSTYHVIDGKQRIETVLRFHENKIRVPDDFGDERLANKRWKEVLNDVDLRNLFLNYSFPVEYFDNIDGNQVNEIFERMNRNARKLNPQEIRNARYDGWFASEVENEVEEPIWRDIGIVTTGRARRMTDLQFLAELFMITIRNEIVGFSHDLIDKAYADYELPVEFDPDFSTEEFKEKLSSARSLLQRIISKEADITPFLSSVSNMYVLWAVLSIDRGRLPPLETLASRYLALMNEVANIAEQQKRLRNAGDEEFKLEYVGSSDEAKAYYASNQSATTELPQRTARLTALRKALRIEG